MTIGLAKTTVIHRSDPVEGKGQVWHITAEIARPGADKPSRARISRAGRRTAAEVQWIVGRSLMAGTKDGFSSVAPHRPAADA
jgi:hypothetical protein